MKKWIYRIIQAILILIILFCGYQIGSYYWQRYQSDKSYENLAEELDLQTEPTSDTSNDATPEVPDYEGIMAKLLAKNEDTVAYLEILGTKNAYPVMQAEDNDFYLRRGFDKADNIQGSLFMDYVNKPNLSDQNTVIYGHTMNQGDAMFGIFKHFYEQEYVDRSEKAFRLFKQDGIYYYRIFSVYRVPADALYRVPNVEPEAWVQFLEDTRAQSEANFGWDKPFVASDRVVTLSTCTDDHNSDYRTAIVGILEKVVTKTGVQEYLTDR